MVKALNLRQYQEDILAKVEAIAGSPSNTANSRLGIYLGNERVLVNLAEISEVLALPDMHAVPLTQPWFVGMANIRGILYGINDLTLLAGQAVTARTSSSRVLLLHLELAPQVGLLVDQLIGLRSLDQFTLTNANATLPLCYKPLEYADAEGQRWLELDCRALIDSKGFMQPGI